MINSNRGHIYLRFVFPTSPLFDAPAQGKPEFLDDTYPAKARGMGYCTEKIAWS